MNCGSVSYTHLMRDALSILDTCAGVTAKIDADVVRRMAGVTDRSYLFHSCLVYTSMIVDAAWECCEMLKAAGVPVNDSENTCLLYTSHL